MEAGTLETQALSVVYGTEPGGEGPSRSVLLTIQALLRRASPSVSGYFYDLLGEDVVDELDD